MNTNRNDPILPTVSPPPKPLANRLATIARSLVVLSTLAVVVACYYGQDVLAPVAVALLLSLLLSPLVTAIEHMRIPRMLASAFSVLLLLTCFIGSLAVLSQPTREWAAKGPAALQSVQHRLADWRAPIRAAQKASETIEGLAKPSDNSAPQVQVKGDHWLLGDILSGTPRILTILVAVILLMFFFLSSGDNFLRRLVEIAPSMAEKKVVVSIARDIQREMSRYLVTVTCINLGLGIATTIVLAVQQVPNAMLWGALASVLNFAPYIGAAMTAAILAIVGLTTFDSLGQALAVPASFLLLAFIEGQIVTPMVIGRRLALNPVVVFVWLLVWGQLWGIEGILLAGPLLACFRIVCRHTQALRPIYILIGEAKFDDSDSADSRR